MLDNDTRGWILTGLSAAACIIGAMCINLDILVRQIPGKKNFNIKDSNAFLSCALSLSSGVMLLSALYKMLPSSKKRLIDSGMDPQKAIALSIGCFLAGALGIQIVTKILHRFMPSHAVDCDHTHDEEEGEHNHGHGHGEMEEVDDPEDKTLVNGSTPSEQTPLLKSSGSGGNGIIDSEIPSKSPSKMKGRPSLRARISSTMLKMATDRKDTCDAEGHCFGYSQPCGNECFKNINSRGGVRRSSWGSPRRPTAALRHSTAGVLTNTTIRPLPPLDEESSVENSHASTVKNENGSARKFSDTALPSMTISDQPSGSEGQGRALSQHSSAPHDDETDCPDEGPLPGTTHATEPSKPHHHHVPQNAFLSISFQTSIAIALHKLPEGFMQYATNHASPNLGSSVFIALAVHNISEGFALALPIFLATNSRLRALLYSIVLGGASQPLGAGVAALWLHIAEKGRGSQNETTEQQEVYGIMFAITSGIMTSVAVSLFQEGQELGHNKGLAVTFVFIGMGILGFSSALTG